MEWIHWFLIMAVVLLTGITGLICFVAEKIWLSYVLR